MMQDMTTLGMSERLERVLAYAFGWLSGIILFVVEKNRNVRWHAAQSIVTFGSLSLISFGVWMLQGMLHWIPLLGLLTDFGLGLLLSALWWLTAILWVWLLVMAWMRPDYRLPFVSNWVRLIV